MELKYQATPKRSGFSLIEILFTIVILAAVILIAVPALQSSLRDSTTANAEANVKSLNQAASRARIQGLVGPGTYGSDKEAAYNWYETNRLLNPGGEIKIENVTYYLGIWYTAAETEGKEFYNGEWTEAAELPENLTDWTHGTPTEAGTDAGLQAAGGWDSLETARDDIGDPTLTLDDIAQLEGFGTWEEYLQDTFNGEHAQTVQDYFDWAITTEQEIALASAFSSFSPSEQASILSNPQFHNSEFFQAVYQDILENGNDDDLYQLLQAVGGWTDPTNTELQNELASSIDWQGLDLTGLSLLGFNLTNTNLTASQIGQASSIQGANLSGLDASGLNPSGQSLAGTDLSNTNITGAQLNQASVLIDANLSNNDLTGFNHTIGLDGVNFSNSTGLTPEALANASSLRNINLSGTGITQAALETALINAGKDPNAYSFDVSTVIF